MEEHSTSYTRLKDYQSSEDEDENTTVDWSKATCQKCRKQYHYIKEMKLLCRGLICIYCLDEEKAKRQSRRKKQKMKILTDPSSGNECDVCHKVFALPSQLKHHYEVHSGIKPFACDICDDRFLRKADIKKHKIYKHTDIRSFECNVCSRSYKCKGALSKHMKTHTSTEVFKCEECGKEFKTYRGSIVHKKIHSGEKLFKCKMCDEAFFTWSASQAHIIKVHKKVKPFLCDICGTSFACSKNFERHKVVHLDQWFKCQMCGMNLRSEYSLKLHYLGLHAPKSEETFTCGVCGKSFGHLLIMKRHQRRHSSKPRVRNLACDICDLKFSTNGCLQKHLRSHSKEKPFTCDACGKKFRYAFTVRRHIKAFHINPNQAKPQRRFTRWSLKDSKAVREYFSSYIKDLSKPNSKGCLPSKDEIDLFLSSHSIFENNCNMDTTHDIYTVVRTKVFNERNKFRQGNPKCD